MEGRRSFEQITSYIDGGRTYLEPKLVLSASDDLMDSSRPAAVDSNTFSILSSRMSCLLQDTMPQLYLMQGCKVPKMPDK